MLAMKSYPENIEAGGKFVFFGISVKEEDKDGCATGASRKPGMWWK